jgi:hypothetical protein
VNFTSYQDAESAEDGKVVLDTLSKSLLRDAYPDLDAASISVPDKLEGLGIGADGNIYAVTDNDGVDENYGEAIFLRLGDRLEAFRP